MLFYCAKTEADEFTTPMIDPTTFPRNLISDSPIDESPNSKFTTVSPETREAAKIVRTSMFLPLLNEEEPISDKFPNILIGNTLDAWNPKLNRS